ncbi:uncharacterized protein LOC111049124 [Nilaparvata lugens]|uniref:uncharacterized protein LOC111049124 n=1 Tax=Nilaparvata lugens TaxID=108931 RepID=UPI00193DE322|nr:uncharacterized protein LOC111049124 [Nilaparvata lugens]
MDKWNLPSRNPTKANLQEYEDWQDIDRIVELQLLETAKYRETFCQLARILCAPPTPNTKKDILRVLLARFRQKCAVKQAMGLIQQQEQSASSTELVHLDQMLRELVIGEDNPAQGGEQQQEQSASSTELVHLDQILRELVIGEDNPAQGGQPPQQ